MLDTLEPKLAQLADELVWWADALTRARTAEP